jgi:hypothetical protein
MARQRRSDSFWGLSNQGERQVFEGPASRLARLENSRIGFVRQLAWEANPSFPGTVLEATGTMLKAQTGGIPARTINYVLTILAALVIVGSMRITGVLLASALLILPTAASLQFARSFRSPMIYSVIFGVLMVNIGLIAHCAAGNWSPSGSVVMAGALLFALTFIVNAIRSRLFEKHAT